METKTIFSIIAVLIIGVLIGISINKNLEFKKAILQEGKEIIGERIVEAHFVAVDNNGNGVPSILETQIRPGTGQILVNINDTLADLNTQYSARLAASVAANYTKTDISNIDIIYNMKTGASVVGGQSAGSIMAVSTIAALENKTIRPNVIITGSILEDGTVAEAGAIRAKAEAAKNANAKIFLVPAGHSSTISTDFKRAKNCYDLDSFHYCIIKYDTVRISLGDELGIQIIEVKNITEALGYFIWEENIREGLLQQFC